MTETTQNTTEDRIEQGELADAAAITADSTPDSEGASIESPGADERVQLISAGPRKPLRFYVDFENVRGAGLKGVDALRAGDEVYVFYSQAAETFHIEQAIDILKSAARVEFVEADAGTSNALDFQLVTALFATFDEAFDHAIVSGDGGFDAAIKMGKRLGLPPVARFANILGDAPTNSGKTKSRVRRSRAKAKTAASDTAEAAETPAQETETAVSASEPAGAAKSSAKPTSRSRSSKPAAKTRPAADAKAVSGSEAEAPQPAKPGESEPMTLSSRDSDSAKAAAQNAASSEASVPAADNVAGADQAASSSESAAPVSADASAEAATTTELALAPSVGTQLGKPRRRGSRGSRGSGKSGKREKIAALLAGAGVEIDQQQLSTVMQALNGVKGKQQFYRNFVKLEGREKGGTLYHQVKAYYETLVDIVRQQ